MTDLTNRTAEEVNVLVQKYGQLLEVSDARKKEDIPVLAIIFDVGINHINANHKDIPKDWKAWSMIVTKRWYFENNIKTEEDVKKIIDEFLTFWKTDYRKYCDDIIAVNEYERDKGFAYRFLWNKKR